MTARTENLPATTDLAPGLTHAFCPTCNPNPQFGQTVTAACGTVKVLTFTTESGAGCVVCAELQDTGCPRCG